MLARRLAETGAFLADIAAVRKLIEPIVAEHGYELVRVKMIGTEAGPALQVMAEDPATGQLVIEQCARLSRAIGEVLDEADLIEEEYNLEVSSPGIDRPLTRLNDYAVWAGHKVKVTLTGPQDGRKKFVGTLLGLDGNAVRLQLDDGDKAEVLLPIDNIDGAKLVLTDELIAATKPQTIN